MKQILNQQPKNRLLLKNLLFPYGVECRRDWTKTGFVLLFSIFAGLLFGFNFFWSNFVIEFTPLAAVLPAAGIVLTYSLFGLFILFHFFLTRFFRRTRNSPEAGNAPRTGQLYRLFFLPLFSFQLLLTFCTAVFLMLDWVSLMVYINDYFRFFIYAWIIAGMMQLTVHIPKPERYRENVLLLCSFCLAFFVLTLILKQVKLEAAGFFR
jgi:hypothetical protein